MKILTFLFLLPFMLFYIPSYAKGHGGRHGGGHGGHGGHGGGQSGGHGGYAGGSHSASSHDGTRHSGGRATSSSATRTLPPINQINGFRSGRGNNMYTPRYKVMGNPTYGNNPYEHWNSYPYYYYGSYGYAPYYDPYFSMWSFGANFMYTPHYSSPATNNDNNEENSNEDPMQGFVVFEHDTISGQVTISKNAISLETKDTARGYDYKFKKKQQGLQYASVYDNDDTTNQLNLVRLKNNKELLREVHIGKLNIYDGKYGFIYRPEDIDVSTIIVVYNGQQDALHSSSVGKTKLWLTDYVNKAYGLELKPKDFTWKELLIYIDKLD